MERKGSNWRKEMENGKGRKGIDEEAIEIEKEFKEINELMIKEE